MTESNTNVAHAVETLNRLRSSLEKVIRGRSDTIKLVLTGLIGNGHVLLEDYPGSGKTTLAKTLGMSIDCSDVDNAQTGIVPFRRVQFTPDLLPTDVLGVNVFEPKSSTFSFQHGPIFAHVVLADEINRTGPKVQAAFLECMAERQVTIDNVTYRLDDLFFVIGTQNPLDLAGTYPLPLVQLDRFLLKIPMRYVDHATELEILNDIDTITSSAATVSPVVSRAEILAARRAVESVHINPAIVEAIVSIVQSTRNNPLLQFGASTRAAIMLKRSLAAWALNEERDYVNEDDLKLLAPFVLQHRLKFHPGAGDPQEAFEELLKPHLEKLIASGMKAAS
ncbi:MAG: MoxR family ATPase [Bdellovibrionales bacterium]|nr:MoxR family ATPase [Bdellovibrionales bacterium]